MDEGASGITVKPGADEATAEAEATTEETPEQCSRNECCVRANRHPGMCKVPTSPTAETSSVAYSSRDQTPARKAAVVPSPAGNGGKRRAVEEATAAATVVLQATAVGIETDAEALLVNRESVASETYRQSKAYNDCKFTKFAELAAGISEDDQAAQLRCLQEAAKFAKDAQPSDPDTEDLRAKLARLRELRVQTAEAERDLATAVANLSAPAGKKRKRV